MSNLISGSRFILAAGLRFGFGLGFVLVGLVATAHAEVKKEDFITPKLNLQTAQSDNDYLTHYHLSASIVLAPALDSTHMEIGLGSSFQLPSTANPQQETAYAINTHWQPTYAGNRVSLPYLLIFEFKGEWVNTTFQPQTALVEGDRLNILLQPHAVSMLWSTVF